MTGSNSDPIEVLRRNDEPARFLWRSRLYTVRSILAYWVEPVTVPAGEPVLVPAGAEPAAVAPPQPAAPGRETWRVRASTGRTPEDTGFDLSFDWREGTWTLSHSPV